MANLKCTICSKDENVVPSVLGIEGPACLACCGDADKLVFQMAPRPHIDRSLSLAQGLYKVAFTLLTKPTDKAA